MVFNWLEIQEADFLHFSTSLRKLTKCSSTEKHYKACQTDLANGHFSLSLSFIALPTFALNFEDCFLLFFFHLTS